MPTDQYRARFGCLAFSCGHGTTVYLKSKGPVVIPRDKTDKTAAVLGDDAQLHDLPSQILEAGVALLTAVIHTFSGSDPFWIVATMRPDQIEWPQESGGQAVVEKIFARWRIMQEPMFEEKQVRVMGDCVDPVLHELLVPERRRQYQEMIEAMDRVCDVIDEQRKRARRLRGG